MEHARHRQTTAPLGLGMLSLSGSVGHFVDVHKMFRSPYFQTTDPRKEAPDRDIQLFLKDMKVISAVLDNFQATNPAQVSVHIGYEDGSGNAYTYSTDVDLTGVHSYEQLRQAVNAVIISFSPSTITEADIQVPGLMARSFTTPSRTINTAFQISTTRDAMAFYSVSIPTNLSLSGGENGAVVLEYADDSGISTNVVTVGTVRNGNTGTLTLGLNTLASMGCQVSGMIPAGKYVRLRPVDTTGSPVQAFVSAQEVLI